jgi:hypothetical protein
MTNKLVVIINSLKVSEIKKMLQYEMKFFVPNYSCLQNPWLGGYHPQNPVLPVLNWIYWTPPSKQNSWVRPCPTQCGVYLLWHTASTGSLLPPAQKIGQYDPRNSSDFSYINPLTPNDPYRGRTAPLTSKRCTLHIYSTNIGTEYFKHCIFSPFFPLQNAFCFMILTYLVPVLFTFYIRGG